MTSHSTDNLQPQELTEYGFARARDIAFDAVTVLWRRRRDAGMKQKELAEIIGRDTSWVSRNLRGPGNWTLRTLGAFVEGLNGELKIIVEATEDQPPTGGNYYSAYDELDGLTRFPGGVSNSAQIIGESTASSYTPDVS